MKSKQNKQRAVAAAGLHHPRGIYVIRLAGRRRGPGDLERKEQVHCFDSVSLMFCTVMLTQTENDRGFQVVNCHLS